MIQSLRVKDFTVFPHAQFEFGALNVIHGENSSGKTHILKLAYSVIDSLVPAPNEPGAGRPTKTALEPKLATKLSAVFRPDNGKIGRLSRRVQGTTRSEVALALSVGRIEFEFATRSDRTVRISTLPDAWLDQSPVFLPTRELLSIAPGCSPTCPTRQTYATSCERLCVP